MKRRQHKPKPMRMLRSGDLVCLDSLTMLCDTGLLGDREPVVRDLLADMIEADREGAAMIEAVPQRSNRTAMQINLALTAYRDRLRFLLATVARVCGKCHCLFWTDGPHGICQACYLEWLDKHPERQHQRTPCEDDDLLAADEPEEHYDETLCFDGAPCDREDHECRRCANVGMMPAANVKDSKCDRGTDTATDESVVSGNGAGTPAPAPQGILEMPF